MAEMAETSSLLELPIWQLECRINWDSDATRYCEKKKSNLGRLWSLVCIRLEERRARKPASFFYFIPP